MRVALAVVACLGLGCLQFIPAIYDIEERPGGFRATVYDLAWPTSIHPYPNAKRCADDLATHAEEYAAERGRALEPFETQIHAEVQPFLLLVTCTGGVDARWAEAR